MDYGGTKLATSLQVAFKSSVACKISRLYCAVNGIKEQQNHHDDCYFCMVNIKGFNRYKKRKWEYPDLKSARQPVLHCENIPVLVFTSLPQLHDSDSKETHALECSETSEGSCSKYEESSSSPKQFTQQKLNDLIIDLNLSKQRSELLASRLKEKNCLQTDAKITFYRNRETGILPLFSRDNDLVYCNVIIGLLLKMKIPNYRPEDWRLFIVSFKKSLKCVLLHNGNRFASKPIAHSTKLKEEYDNIKTVLQRICFEEHQWSICVDLKMVNFLLGQQTGYTKYPCFMCLWDSRAIAAVCLLLRL